MLEHSPERCRFKSIQAVEVVPQMCPRLRTKCNSMKKDGRVTMSLAIWSDFSKNLLKNKFTKTCPNMHVMSLRLTSI